jgi:hypothetical protein
LARLAALDVGDPPDVWASLGFTLDGQVCDVDGVVHRLGGDGEGVFSWALDGAPSDVAGLKAGTPLASGPSGAAHPNGVVSLDHLVVSTPDLGRTIDDLEAAGIELRRTRDAGGKMVQAFFKLGAVVLEVVGASGSHAPGMPSKAEAGAPRFWGLAFTVEDLDATAAFLGERLRPAKDAVQPGRRIATLDRSAGSTVPIAFMSADESRLQRE